MNLRTITLREQAAKGNSSDDVGGKTDVRRTETT